MEDPAADSRPTEHALARAVTWLLVSLVPVPLLLIVDRAGHRLTAVVVHLSVVIAAALALGWPRPHQ